MFTRKPRLQLRKIVISSAKRLLQHNRTKADNGRFWSATVCPLALERGDLATESARVQPVRSALASSLLAPAIVSENFEAG